MTGFEPSFRAKEHGLLVDRGCVSQNTAWVLGVIPPTFRRAAVLSSPRETMLALQSLCIWCVMVLLKHLKLNTLCTNDTILRFPSSHPWQQTDCAGQLMTVADASQTIHTKMCWNPSNLPCSTFFSLGTSILLFFEQEWNSIRSVTVTHCLTRFEQPLWSFCLWLLNSTQEIRITTCQCREEQSRIYPCVFLQTFIYFYYEEFLYLFFVLFCFVLTQISQEEATKNQQSMNLLRIFRHLLNVCVSVSGRSRFSVCVCQTYLFSCVPCLCSSAMACLLHICCCCVQ